MLFVKANRFLSKDNVKKEKQKIKKEAQANTITGDKFKEGRMPINDGYLV